MPDLHIAMNFDGEWVSIWIVRFCGMIATLALIYAINDKQLE